MASNNTSGFKGVFWYPKYQKWMAGIGVNGRVKNLGYFDDIADAVAAYDAAAHKLFGVFANTNSAMGLTA